MNRRTAARPQIRRHVIAWLPLVVLAAVLGSAGGARAEDDERPWPARGVPDGPERAVDHEHVRLELRVDPRVPRLEGVAFWTVRALRDDVQTVVFDAIDLGPGAATDQEGRALGVSDEGDRWLVTLAAPLAAGERVTLRLPYTAAPKWGMFFVGPDPNDPERPPEAWTQGETNYNRHWFPNYESPDDRVTSEVVATVPTPFSAWSNGTLETVTSAGDERTFHWRLDADHPTYLVALAVGDYREVRERCDDVLLGVVAHERDLALLERSFADTCTILRLIGARVGVPYPYPTYRQVILDDFLHWGMENTSATFLTRKALHDERAHVDVWTEGLVAHELAHQWYGDLVATRTWAHTWLNEGFATFVTFDVMRDIEGEDRARSRWYGTARQLVAAARDGKARPIVHEGFRHPGEMFDDQAYAGGAWRLRTLRRLLGEGPFWRGVRTYTERSAGRSVETDELRRAFEDESGRRLRPFFDAWLGRGGLPGLRADAAETNSLDEAVLVTVTVRQTQAGPAWPMDVDVRLVDGTGKPHATAEVSFAAGEHEQTIEVWTGGGATRVEIDPEGRWLFLSDDGAPLASLVTAAAAGTTPWVRARALDDLARRLGDAKARRRARADARAAFEAAREALGRPDALFERQAAARLLARDDTAPSRTALVEALQGDPIPEVRQAAARALGGYGPAALEPLLACVSGERSWYTAAACLEGAGATGEPAAVAAARAALDVDSVRDVVAAAGIAVLGDHGNVEDLERLLLQAAPAATTYRRIAAYRALGALAVRHRAVALRARPLLVAGLDSPRHEERGAAATGLGQIGGDGIRSALADRQRKEPDGRVREAITRAFESLSK